MLLYGINKVSWRALPVLYQFNRSVSNKIEVLWGEAVEALFGRHARSSRDVRFKAVCSGYSGRAVRSVRAALFGPGRAGHAVSWWGEISLVMLETFAAMFGPIHTFFPPLPYAKNSECPDLYCTARCPTIRGGYVMRLRFWFVEIRLIKINRIICLIVFFSSVSWLLVDHRSKNIFLFRLLIMKYLKIIIVFFIILRTTVH